MPATLLLSSRERTELRAYQKLTIPAPQLRPLTAPKARPQRSAVSLAGPQLPSAGRAERRKPFLRPDMAPISDIEAKKSWKDDR